MTTLKQIPRKGLAAYFDAFTKRFLRDGSPEAVDVEVVAPELGDQQPVQGARLLGITYDEDTRTRELAVAGRQAQLDAMKRRATGRLALAAAVFAGASSFEGQYPWLGYVRATAEASLVGGLADWFAVTALFRHPLGLPIPHTAIVATRKERIGQILGNFVQNHFLSREVIATNLRRVHPAERAAQWLADPEHARQIARQFASRLVKTLDGLPPNALQDLVSQVERNRVRTFRLAPALRKTLALALGDSRQEELLNATVNLAAEAGRSSR